MPLPVPYFPEPYPVIVKLGYALSIKTKYIQKRGNIYQFAMRIPSDLIGHYGQRHIRLRKPLKVATHST